MSEKKSRERQSTAPEFKASFLLPRYWLAWIALLCFYCLSWLPSTILDLIGNSLGDLAAKKNKKRYQIAKINLSLCYPNKSDQDIKAMVKAHFRIQARAVMQYAKLWWYPKSLLLKQIEIKGFEQVEAIKQKGGNVIILLCHSVSLDVAVHMLSTQHKMACPYKPTRNPLLNWLIVNRRTRYGLTLFTREDGLRPLIKAVGHGRILLYPADEDLGAKRCIFAPFFGIQKATVPVLGRLATKTNSTVFTCISCYDKTRAKYVVRIMPAIESLSGNDDLSDTTQMNVAIEEAVTQCPTQYMWTLKLFKTRPDGEPSVYQ